MPVTFNMMNLEKGKFIRMYCAPGPAEYNWNGVARNWIMESPGLAMDLYDAGLRLVMVLDGIQTDDGEAYWPEQMKATIDNSKVRIIKDVKFGSSIPGMGLMMLYPPFSLDVLLHESMHFFKPEAGEEEIGGHEEEYVAKYSPDLAAWLEQHPDMWMLRDIKRLKEYLAEPCE